MWPQLIAAAAIAAAAASSAWWLTADHYQGVMAKAVVAAQGKIDEANDRADKAATDWQAWAAKQQKQVVYRDRAAKVVFAAEPAWAAASVPESVRRLLTQPTGAAEQAASSVPDPMRAASAAANADERAAGSVLSRDEGFIRRLFSTPPQPSESTEHVSD